MDQKSLDYGMSVLDEIGAAVAPIGMTVEKQDPRDTEGIPTGRIRPEGAGGWTVTCSVVPTHKDDVSTTFVQLSIPLTAPCPERREELERFAQAANAQFLMGTLVMAGDALWMKYVAVLEPTIAMEESHMQAAVFAFCQQGEALATRARAVCRDGKTAEEALAMEIG